MKIIVDVNVIPSALIRDSTTRKIILNSEFDLYFPEHSLHKIRKYKSYILEKSGLTEEEYDKIISTLFKYSKQPPVRDMVAFSWRSCLTTFGHFSHRTSAFLCN